MASDRSLADFLARLPSILGAISKGVVRSIVLLLERLRAAIWNAMKAVGDLIARGARWLWSLYAQIENSIVEVLANLVLTIWSTRLLLGLLLVAVVFGYFRWWWVLLGYLSVLALAVLLYFKRPESAEEDSETQAQLPLKGWLKSAFTWVLRVTIALASGVLYVASSTSLVGSGGSFVSSAMEVAQRAAIKLKDVASLPATLTPSAIGEASPPTQVGRGPTPASVKADPSSAARAPEAIPVAEVAKTVEESVLRVLAVAQTANAHATERAAREAARSYDFSVQQTARVRKEARELNDAAIRAFQADEDYRDAYQLGSRAFAADPFDVEIAGNLAIFAFRTGRIDEAYQYTLYAMALPRGADRTGRTADWSTLAAVFAERGDAVRARNALLVTLAIAPDVSKRCAAAVYSVRKTYGSKLRAATESMLQHIREQGLSDSPQCAAPVDW